MPLQIKGRLRGALPDTLFVGGKRKRVNWSEGGRAHQPANLLLIPGAADDASSLHPLQLMMLLFFSSTSFVISQKLIRGSNFVLINFIISA